MCVLARSGETLHPSDEPHLTGLTAGTVTRSADADHDAQILCGKACHSISAMISSDVCGWWSVPRVVSCVCRFSGQSEPLPLRELARAAIGPDGHGRRSGIHSPCLLDKAKEQHNARLHDVRRLKRKVGSSNLPGYAGSLQRSLHYLLFLPESNGYRYYCGVTYWQLRPRLLLS